MRIFILVLVLIFSLQSWTKADDIRDFQIEGMSIGDSALDYLNEKEIKKGIQYNYYNDDLYLASQINKKFDNYDGVTINFFSNDKNYIIQAISGFKFMNIEKCLKEIKLKKLWIKYGRIHLQTNILENMMLIKLVTANISTYFTN